MTGALETVTPDQLEAMLNGGENLELIDVRSPAEFEALHAAAATNIPLDQLHGAALADLARRSSRHSVYVICQKGGRGQTACERLVAAGAERVANVAGGTAAWAAAGMPVVRGKPAMSLERQVRIAAGSLVVMGAALAWWVHPAFVGLCAFVGAGLVFAGVTDTCGMAMILAKAPWNQRPASSAFNTPGR
jgi:rhodanese-related sulfurtransferase